MSPAVNTLFQEVERLDNRSLDNFISTIISLRVRRNIPNKQKEEASLLEKINKGLPFGQVERFRNLNQKRIESSISEQENAELLILLEKIEKLNANRLKYLTSLARLRNISVRELMKQMGING